MRIDYAEWCGVCLLHADFFDEPTKHARFTVSFLAIRHLWMHNPADNADRYCQESVVHDSHIGLIRVLEDHMQPARMKPASARARGCMLIKNI